MSQIDNKLDKIVDTLGQQAVTLARLTVSVEEHVRRTNLLEEDIKPIKSHVSMVQGAIKVFGFLAVLAAIGEGLAAWMKR